MLDVSATHPFVACTAFAMEWLGYIAAYDLSKAESLIDVNDAGTPFAQSFPAPEGFTYCHPNRIKNWSMHITAANEDGLYVDCEVPFVEKDFRPMVARFSMNRKGNLLEVRFEGLVPS